MSHTVRLHRVLVTKPEKVYRAFLEPDALARWLPPNGFTGTVHSMNAVVGGSFRMSFRNFTTGLSHAFNGNFSELRPYEFLSYEHRFEGDQLPPGEMRVTVQLKKVTVGTEVDIVQAGIPGVIPLDGCYLGWQESLRHLAKLVEPDIQM